MILSVIVLIQDIIVRNIPEHIASSVIIVIEIVIIIAHNNFVTGIFCFETANFPSSFIFISTNDSIVSIGSDLIYNAIENTENNDRNQCYC